MFNRTPRGTSGRRNISGVNDSGGSTPAAEPAEAPVGSYSHYFGRLWAGGAGKETAGAAAGAAAPAGAGAPAVGGESPRGRGSGAGAGTTPGDGGGGVRPSLGGRSPPPRLAINVNEMPGAGPLEPEESVTAASTRSLTDIKSRDAVSRRISDGDPLFIRNLDVMRKRAALNMDVERPALDKLAVALRRRLPTTVHRRLVHSYEDCFRGADAVTWLVANAIFTDAEDAKNAMRHLLYRRIILRVDHTKPLFNSAIEGLMPSLAHWRAKKQLRWYQDSARRYNLAALYSFNVRAFSKFQVVVGVVGARGLRYTRHNHLRAAWEVQKIAPMAHVQLGAASQRTSVEGDSPEPKWDETLMFDFDHTSAQHDELWVHVFNFHQVSNSMKLGVACVQTRDILRQCGVDPDSPVPPPANVFDAPGWVAWHPLVPPVEHSEPDEVRGGSVQLQFQVITNVVETPDETVHDECRPGGSAARHRARDAAAAVAPDSSEMTRHSSFAHPTTVLKYQHMDRRPAEELAAKRPGGGPARAPAYPALPGQPLVLVSSSYDCWTLDLRQLELHGIMDVSPGQLVTIIATATSSRSSSKLLDLRKKMLALGITLMDEPGLIARRRSPAFLWPKDGRKVVKAGRISLIIPSDVLKDVTVELKLVRKNDLGNKVTVGHGKTGLGSFRLCDESEPGESDEEQDEQPEAEGSAGAGDPGAAGLAKTMKPQTARAMPLATGSFGAGGAPEDAAADEDGPPVQPGPGGKFPECDDLPPQRRLKLIGQDTHSVVLRRLAAFKRNIKIKSGTVFFAARLLPLLNEDDLEGAGVDEDDTAATADVDFEEALKGVTAGKDGETPKPIKMPAPLANVYVDQNIAASVQKLAQLLLASNSKFEEQFAKERKNTDMVVGPWVGPKPDQKDAATSSPSQSKTPAGSSPSGPPSATLYDEDAVTDLARLKSSMLSPPRPGLGPQGSEESVPPSSPGLARIGSLGYAEMGILSAPLAPSSSTSSFASSAAAAAAGEPGKPGTESPPSPAGRTGEQDAAAAAAAPASDDTFTSPRRTVTFVIPASSLTKAAKATEVQEILELGPGGFVYTSSTAVPDVPYGDRFTTSAQFVVTYVGPNESHLRISGEPVWTDKGAPGFPIKGFVLSGVKNGHMEAFTAKRDMLVEWVAPKRVLKKKKQAGKDGKEEEAEAAPAPTRRFSTRQLAALAAALALLALLAAVTSRSGRAAVGRYLAGLLRVAADTFAAAEDDAARPSL
jgi:hypothetical protein